VWSRSQGVNRRVRRGAEAWSDEVRAEEAVGRPLVAEPSEVSALPDHAVSPEAWVDEIANRPNCASPNVQRHHNTWVRHPTISQSRERHPSAYRDPRTDTRACDSHPVDVDAESGRGMLRRCTGPALGVDSHMRQKVKRGANVHSLNSPRHSGAHVGRGGGHAPSLRPQCMAAPSRGSLAR